MAPGFYDLILNLEEIYHSLFTALKVISEGG